MVGGSDAGWAGVRVLGRGRRICALSAQGSESSAITATTRGRIGLSRKNVFPGCPGLYTLWGPTQRIASTNKETIAGDNPPERRIVDPRGPTSGAVHVPPSAVLQPPGALLRGPLVYVSQLLHGAPVCVCQLLHRPLVCEL